MQGSGSFVSAEAEVMADKPAPAREKKGWDRPGVEAMSREVPRAEKVAGRPPVSWRRLSSVRNLPQYAH
jgi:hypothetical protein